MKETNLNHKSLNFILNLPDWYLIKSRDKYRSKFIAGNLNVIRLLGFNSQDSFIGKTDFDINCRAVEFAHIYNKEDEEVIKYNQPLSILYCLELVDSKLHFIYAKKAPFKFSENDETHIFFQAYSMNDSHLKRLIRNVISLDMKYREIKQKKGGCYYLVEDDIGPLKLSKQQYACLYYLLRGKSAQAISNYLNLSKRTTEHYINILKDKFSCTNKSQLIESAIELGYLYYLPKMTLPID